MITSLRPALVKSDCSPSPKVKQLCCINVVETGSHYAASRAPYIELYLHLPSAGTKGGATMPRGFMVFSNHEFFLHLPIFNSRGII